MKDPTQLISELRGMASIFNQTSHASKVSADAATLIWEQQSEILELRAKVVDFEKLRDASKKFYAQVVANGDADPSVIDELRRELYPELKT